MRRWEYEYVARRILELSSASTRWSAPCVPQYVEPNNIKFFTFTRSGWVKIAFARSPKTKWMVVTILSLKDRYLSPKD